MGNSLKFNLAMGLLGVGLGYFSDLPPIPLKESLWTSVAILLLFPLWIFGVAFFRKLIFKKSSFEHFWIFRIRYIFLGIGIGLFLDLISRGESVMSILSMMPFVVFYWVICGLLFLRKQK